MTLRAGDWVEVRTREEILSTLDGHGSLQGLPFMPEMLQYCGKRFRIYKSAHKTCDTITDAHSLRRMEDAVHLDMLRCDGAAHGGCQAGCLFFWKKAWLKPVKRQDSGTDFAKPTIIELTANAQTRSLSNSVEGDTTGGAITEERYSCQATELLRATTPLKWWHVRPYILDLISRNIRIRDFIRSVAIAGYNIVMRLHWRGRPYPDVRGHARGKTPTTNLNLQPGELIEVRSKEEILQTIDEKQRNRGLWFDVEMTPYCGRRHRVLRRVDRIINEKTGLMMRLPSDCLILEGVTCGGLYSKDRLFCPRSIYPYWREVWLKRVPS